MAPPDLATISAKLDNLADKLDDLSEDINRAPRDGKPGGILFVVDKLGDRVKALEDNRNIVKLVALNVLTALLGGSATAYVATHLIR